jgi:hypothetical protein
MKNLIGSLIVVSPRSPRLFKFQFTKTAIAVLALACVISFCAVVAIGYSFPRLMSEGERRTLENENQELRVRNLNVEIRAEQVNDRLSRLEEQSKRITDLMQTD